jgi:hypothetical protein
VERKANPAARVEAPADAGSAVILRLPVAFLGPAIEKT